MLKLPIIMVYCGLYPVENSDYDNLRDALEKLQLNDASLMFEPETSAALGFGFRCGFLGLLHMDVIKERLEREYNLTLLTTAPNVIYEVFKTNGEVEMVDNPSLFPPQTVIDHVEEPYVNATIIVPKDYVGPVMELSQEKRGEYANMTILPMISFCLLPCYKLLNKCRLARTEKRCSWVVLSKSLINRNSRMQKELRNC